ncbi:MAG: hypothetical protein GY943_05685 [Chloroflexi bacterium]|nr:hypothetical protein [Chloroflexota bacterium]
MDKLCLWGIWLDDGDGNGRCRLLVLAQTRQFARTTKIIMTTHSTGHDMPLYEIKIKGHVDSQWQEWFDGLTITLTDNGNTILIHKLPKTQLTHFSKNCRQ